MHPLGPATCMQVAMQQVKQKKLPLCRMLLHLCRRQQKVLETLHQDMVMWRLVLHGVMLDMVLHSIDVDGM